MSNPKTTTSRAVTVWLVIQNALTFCAVIILFSMMMLTSVDVVARYVFNSPLPGAFELVQIALATLVYLAMPVATFTGSHIAVELLPLPNNSVVRRSFDIFVRLVCAVTFGYISWEVWHHAGKLMSYGQVTNSLEIPVAHVAYIVALGAGISVIAALFQKHQN
ncbi:MAG: TRAP transporter small permease [Paracoccaceae bacterium]